LRVRAFFRAFSRSSAASQYKAQLAKMRPGPAKNALQQRALRVLKQRKMYEKQRDVAYQQQFNIDQTKFAQESLKETATTVKAMKSAQKELAKGIKEVNISEVEDLHDDMSDLLEDNDEIQEILGRQYGVPEAVDEDELLDELNALEDEIAQEESVEETPAYIKSAANARAQQQQQQVALEQEQRVDEHGLPTVNAAH
jgi:charged multivesicular body protein 5